MSTEGRNPRSMSLDRMRADQIVRLMTTEEGAALKAVAEAEASLALAATAVCELYLAGGRVIYVGSGTSGRLGALDAAEMPPTFGVDPGRWLSIMSGGSSAMGKAVENAEDDTQAAEEAMDSLGLTKLDAVIGLAASGTTPFVLAAVKRAREKGAWTCGIACNGGTPLLEVAELGILLDTGPEVLTGSTRLKAGTAQKLALNRISTTAMVLAGKVRSNLMIDVKASNAKLRARCIRIVSELRKCSPEEAKDLLLEHRWSVRAALDH